MKLSEKIYESRKKAGLSQEALAEKLGVSRQAVSKWETGESDPEISKLKLLAEIFGVSVDWLLSEEDSKERKPQDTASESQVHAAPEWLENLPGHLRNLVKRFGWLAGFCVALYGLAMAIAGMFARFLFMQMFSDTLALAGPEVLSRNPVYLVSGLMMILGAIVIAAGAILAIILKKKLK